MYPGGAEQFSLLRIEVGSTQDQKPALIQEERERPETHAGLSKALKAVPNKNEIEALEQFRNSKSLL
jgi:hypothetical protein